MNTILIQQIDALLPQTQCGLCGFGGCHPYASALASGNATINLCPPGGIETLLALGELLACDAAPYLIEMQQKKKMPMLAVIREAECIGCTKCIQACPVDAIMGSAKHMHTIIRSECTGCELCVPSCPVDCIDMLIQAEEKSAQEKKSAANYWRERFQAKEQRLHNEKTAKKKATITPSLASKKEYIQTALARAKAKKTK